jgi:hypothetical protein
MHMFREINHARTEALVDYIRILPVSEQKFITRQLNSKKKLSAKEKRKLKELKGIAEGLREIKESKRTGKPMKTLDEFLNEL